MGADGFGRVGPVNAILGAAEIHGPRAERIAGGAGHLARQIRLALDHLWWRGPVLPFRLLGYGRSARPGEAVAADADAVADRLAAREHIVEIGVGRIDDDRAGRF